MVNLHIRADLRCLKVFIRGQKARISEISIEGIGVSMSRALHLYAMKLEMQANGVSLSCSLNHPGLVSEILMKKKEMEVLANLKNIVILDCDKDAIYKKVQSASGLSSKCETAYVV